MKHLKLTTLAFVLVQTATTAIAQDEPWASNEKTTFKPKVHHPNIASVSLFAQNPDIVTPVGIAVAPDGRVFVQENHTHKRQGKYKGPKTDRILVFEDTDGDGISDKRAVFYEGHTFSTDMLFGPDGHLYVSTRWFIGRFANAATTTKAEGEPDKLVVCETDGDYPHNGVGGLAIDPANPDWLAFGFGENLGVAYTFVGTDGTKFSGEAEGGSTYRVRTDGTKLTKLSTGHWNAFGMCYGLAGNLYSTDNDPNATPPNRLLHIVPGADFGYEYRYGRSGRHPLVCWYGENPGTLGMIGALGEAACGLVPHGPSQLLSASWTDNRVDLHTLKPKGASFVAERAPFLSGPDEFRPVHFSYSADGKYLYFTDWVKISYPVHGHGRIWRVEFKEPINLKPLPREAKQKRLSKEERLKQLGSDDPYARTHAMYAFSKHPESLEGYKWEGESNATARAHYAITLKRIDAKKNAGIIPKLMTDADSEVRFVGIKWIADEGLDQYRLELEAILRRSDLTRRDLRATLAALARIGGRGKKEFLPQDKLVEIAFDATRPSALRAIALQNVKVDHKRLTIKALAELTRSSDSRIQSEAIRSLALHADPGKGTVLANVASDKLIDANVRANAIAGLASIAKNHAPLIEKLANDSNQLVTNEAKRTRRAATPGSNAIPKKPAIDDLPAWEKLVDGATGTANPEVGRRLFFHSALGGCYRCHAMNGRGSSVGPDLTTIHKQSGITRNRLLKHIVNPSAEMAPYYRPQLLVTTEGKSFTGLVVGQEGGKQAYVGSDGIVFIVERNDVEERKELTTSIMPNGLLDRMNAEEIRDLLAYLLRE